MGKCIGFVTYFRNVAHQPQAKPQHFSIIQMQRAFVYWKCKGHYNVYLYLYKDVDASFPVWRKCNMISNRTNPYWPQHKCDQSLLPFVDRSLLDSSCKYVL